jgi:SAM-dependent methyltransferase
VTLERVDISHCDDRLQVVLHRQRYDFVLARVSSGDDVLEIGVGAGVFSQELLARSRSYVGVEYDPVTCAEARKKTGYKAEIIEADARSLPFANEQFSFVVCLEVLEHLGNYGAGVRNIHRCLRRDGAAIISVPYRLIGGKSLGNEHHPYEPGEIELVSLLRRIFEQVEVYYQYFEEPWWWRIVRVLHVRRFVGLAQIYADLAAGLPRATARLHIDAQARGRKEGLIVVVRGKRRAFANG